MSCEHSAQSQALPLTEDHDETRESWDLEGMASDLEIARGRHRSGGERREQRPRPRPRLPRGPRRRRRRPRRPRRPHGRQRRPRRADPNGHTRRTSASLDCGANTGQAEWDHVIAGFLAPRSAVEVQSCPETQPSASAPAAASARPGTRTTTTRRRRRRLTPLPKRAPTTMLCPMPGPCPRFRRPHRRRQIRATGVAAVRQRRRRRAAAGRRLLLLRA